MYRGYGPRKLKDEGFSEIEVYRAHDIWDVVRKRADRALKRATVLYMFMFGMGPYDVSKSPYVGIGKSTAYRWYEEYERLKDEIKTDVLVDHLSFHLLPSSFLSFDEYKGKYVMYSPGEDVYGPGMRFVGLYRYKYHGFVKTYKGGYHLYKMTWDF
jgi:hypothetical protein